MKNIKQIDRHYSRKWGDQKVPGNHDAPDYVSVQSMRVMQNIPISKTPNAHCKAGPTKILQWYPLVACPAYRISPARPMISHHPPKTDK